MAKFLSGDLTAAEKLETIFPDSADTSRLLVAVHPADYSASAIAKAVEDCDVQLLELTVTAMRTRGGRHVVLLRVAAADTRSLERSLERYGYETLSTDAPGDPRLRDRDMARANELLHILEL